MRLLPYDSFQIETPLPLEEAIERLSSRIDQHQLGWLLQSSYSEFRGTIEGNDFKISKISGNRNSFLPIVTGTFYPSAIGTLIKIEMGPRPITLFFMLFWLISVGFGAATSIFSALGTGFSDQLLFSIVIPIGMLLAGILVPMGSFWYEVNQHKKKLSVLFKGTVIE